MDYVFDVFAIGDSTFDTFISPDESELLCTIDNKKCLVCFNYGDKIPVKSLNFSVGGNAPNHAAGASKLGLRSSISTVLGEDIVGKQIFDSLVSSGVNVDHVVRDSQGTSNYSSVINYGGERTIFSYHSPKTYFFSESLPASKWVYLTSMGEGYESFWEAISNFIKKQSDTKLAINPGSRQLRGNTDILKKAISVCDLLYVNRDEAEKITETTVSQNNEKELLGKLLALGLRMAIITDGPNGAFFSDGKVYLYAPVIPQEAIERTGAGDAFGSGFLSGLIHGKTIPEALMWGSANSSSVIKYPGAQKGLLTLEDILQVVEKAEQEGIIVKEL